MLGKGHCVEVTRIAEAEVRGEKLKNGNMEVTGW